VLLGAAMQADPLHVLFSSPAGRLLCLLGVALDACGLAWTHRLTARAQRT
jgi:tight adherence protein B